MGKISDLVELYKDDKVLSELVLSKVSLNEIALYMGTGSGTCAHALNDLGLRHPKSRGHLCKVEPVLWDELTSYILGYFLGDGCMHRQRSFSERSQMGQLDISSSDYSHIEKINKALGDFRIMKSLKIVETKNLLSYRMSFSDKRWYKFLCYCGITPNKSNSPSRLNHYPDDSNIRHFIRGLFESDGSISNFINKGRFCSKFEIEGNLLYLDFIHVKMPWLRLVKDRKLDVLVCCSLSDIVRSYHYLYDESTIFMERKKIKLEEVENEYKVRLQGKFNRVP